MSCHGFSPRLSALVCVFLQPLICVRGLIDAEGQDDPDCREGFLSLELIDEDVSTPRPGS